jgi:hypothetical protein
VSCAAPYTRQFDDIAIVGGTASVHTLGYPHRGILRRLNAVIVNGDGASGVGGTLQLFSAEVDAANPDMMKLIKEFTLSGNTFASGDIFTEYKNTEGDACNHVRKLYARVVATGTGSKTISLSLTMAPPQF